MVGKDDYRSRYMWVCIRSIRRVNSDWCVCLGVVKSKTIFYTLPYAHNIQIRVLRTLLLALFQLQFIVLVSLILVINEQNAYGRLSICGCRFRVDEKKKLACPLVSLWTIDYRHVTLVYITRTKIVLTINNGQHNLTVSR